MDQSCLGMRCATGSPNGLRSISMLGADSSKRPGPIAEYDARVKAGKIKDDEHQRGIVQYLQDLHTMLKSYNPPRVIPPKPPSPPSRTSTFFNSILHRSPPVSAPLPMPPADQPKGLYMYGDVGSGKTMLMDLFYATLPPNVRSKTRIHFHNFMQDVHKQLHAYKMAHPGNDLDAIPFVAATIASHSSVLCFDEFQCTDVADAMILRRLLQALLAHGTVLVTTSNRHPKELYKNGIQRSSFIPCINLLLTRLTVLNLDSPTDYRSIPRPASGVYHHPLDIAAKTHAEKWYRYLGDSKEASSREETVHVWGREVHVPRANGKCCWYTFDELVEKGNMGPGEYLALAEKYNAFVITGIKQLAGERQRDWGRRFVTFLDAVYEAKATLVLTTEVPIHQLFVSPQELEASLKVHPAQLSPSGSGNSKDKSVNDHPTTHSASVHHSTTADADTLLHQMADDLGLGMEVLKNSSLFSGEEERFAFGRALSRLREMGGQGWGKTDIEAKGREWG
ncbi:Palmitoyltransferase zdhhc13 [Agyrium rufum]|nr:Palmitoyltransferase zdhhc13 [Agyrium rufum]